MGDLFDWARERDEAMERVEAHAEEVVPGFTDMARGFVIGYLQKHTAASGEVIVNAAKAAGIQAHDDRAFGPIFMALAKDGKIEKTGTAIRKKGHGTSGAVVWKLKQEETR